MSTRQGGQKLDAGAWIEPKMMKSLLNCLLLLLLLSLQLIVGSEGWLHSNAPSEKPPMEASNGASKLMGRRDALMVSTTTATATVGFGNTFPAKAAESPTRPRTVDVGGGVDMSVDTSRKIISDPPDVVFPASLEGRWACERQILSVEGDQFQAQAAWKNLGGSTKDFPKTFEKYEVQMIPAPFDSNKNSNSNSNSSSKYTVLDRAAEITARIQSSTGSAPAKVNWKQPNVLTHGDTNLVVIQRSVIPPNIDQGIIAGTQELIRIQDGPFVRAALVKQRFRPASATTGSGSIAAIEGLEILKTFRVLDGVAGTELPTSTIKSRLLLTKLN